MDLVSEINVYIFHSDNGSFSSITYFFYKNKHDMPLDVIDCYKSKC